MKGQSSLELLVTVGIVIAFTIPVLFLMLSVTSMGYEDTTRAQADAASRTLTDTMNSVYAMGPGAKKTVLLNVPAATEEVYAEDGEVVVSIRTSAGTYDAASPTIAEISGTRESLGKKTGLFVVNVQTNAAGEVELVEPS